MASSAIGCSSFVPLAGGRSSRIDEIAQIVSRRDLRPLKPSRQRFAALVNPPFAERPRLAASTRIRRSPGRFASVAMMPGSYGASPTRFESEDAPDGRDSRPTIFDQRTPYPAYKRWSRLFVSFDSGTTASGSTSATIVQFGVKQLVPALVVTAMEDDSLGDSGATSALPNS